MEFFICDDNDKMEKLNSLSDQELKKIYVRSMSLNLLGYLLAIITIVFFFGWLFYYRFMLLFTIPMIAQVYVFLYARTTAARIYFYTYSLLSIISSVLNIGVISLLIFLQEKVEIYKIAGSLFLFILGSIVLKAANTKYLFGKERFTHNQIVLLRKVRKQIPLEESDKIPEVQPEPIVSNVCVVIVFIWLAFITIIGWYSVIKAMPVKHEITATDDKTLVRNLAMDIQLISGMFSRQGGAWIRYDDQTLHRALNKVGDAIGLPTKHIDLPHYRPRTYFEYSDLGKALDVFGLISICKDEERMDKEQLTYIAENLDNADEKQIQLLSRELERQRRLLLFPSLIDDVVCAIRWFLEAVIIWIFIYLLFFNKRKMSSAKSQKSDNFQNGDL